MTTSESLENPPPSKKRKRSWRPLAGRIKQRTLKVARMDLKGKGKGVARGDKQETDSSSSLSDVDSQYLSSDDVSAYSLGLFLQSFVRSESPPNDRSHLSGQV